MSTQEEHRRIQEEAVKADGTAQAALLAGQVAQARAAFAGAARLYRESWDAAPAGSFGRLVGLVKAAALASERTAGQRPSRGDVPAADPAAPPGADPAHPGVDPSPARGELAEVARFVRDAVGPEPPSPAAAYAVALASLALADDVFARSAAALMRPGGDAFARAADAIQALADRDAGTYAAALQAIVDDFAARDDHLTGIPIADTAVVLERFAAERGIAARPSSPLVPSS